MSYLVTYVFVFMSVTQSVTKYKQHSFQWSLVWKSEELPTWTFQRENIFLDLHTEQTDLKRLNYSFKTFYFNSVLATLSTHGSRWLFCLRGSYGRKPGVDLTPPPPPPPPVLYWMMLLHWEKHCVWILYSYFLSHQKNQRQVDVAQSGEPRFWLNIPRRDNN